MFPWLVISLSVIFLLNLSEGFPALYFVVRSPNPSSCVRNAISKGRDNSTLTVADNNLVTLLDMNSHGSNSGIRTSSAPGKNHLEQIYVDNTNLYIDPSDVPTVRQIRSLNAEICALKAELESKEKVSPDNEGTSGVILPKDQPNWFSIVTQICRYESYVYFLSSS